MPCDALIFDRGEAGPDQIHVGQLAGNLAVVAHFACREPDRALGSRRGGLTRLWNVPQLWPNPFQFTGRENDGQAGLTRRLAGVDSGLRTERICWPQ